MKKMIFLAASAALCVSGVRAADVVPNHIRHPLHVAAVKTLAPKSVVRMGAATASSSSTYAPTLAPGGLSNANVIAGLSWSALLGDTATYADNSVQQADIGSTVAPLDASGNVKNPVVSSVSNATASATFSGSVARDIKSVMSDTKEVKNYGAKLDDSQIYADLNIINSLWATNPHLVKISSGAIWPHSGNSAIVPSGNTGNIVVQAQGEINLWPSYPVTDYGIGFPVPYFGDGVSSILYGANASVALSRVDANDIGFNANLPNVAYNYVADTTKEPGNAGAPGMLNINIHTVAGRNKKGMESGVNDIFDSLSLGGFGDDDVQDWHHMGIYGTDWTWSNIQEVNQYVPFYFSTGVDGNYNQATYINEEDFATGGPENSKSSYDPTQFNRKMFWLAHGYGTMGYGTVDASGNKTAHIADAVTWKASTSYHRYQEIIVADQSGQPFTFYALSKSYTPSTGSPDSDASGATAPTWNFTTGSTTADGDLVWTCLGPFTADLGEVFGISGDNAPGTGWVARIGTLMSEDTDYIYDALFDFSKAAFDPNVTHVFTRMQKDMFLDLTADGTQAGQNNRLFGYTSGVGLAYTLSGSANGTGTESIPFYVADNGITKMSAFSVGSDTGSITNGREILRALNMDGSVPSSELSLRYSYPDLHMYVDNSDFGMIVRRVGVPASSSASCNEGDIAQDQNYLYMCVASNSWKRSALESW
ncbi:hypothetical protein J4P41_07105 [Gluconobacter sp. NFX36]|uniref:hypothetical protein n=1 Tax=Gluconobacter sp. NFX36 TaxID=2819535 RepID=UPI003CE7FBA2